MTPDPSPFDPDFAPTAPETPPPPAGWYPDPSGRHEQRYWSGALWTKQVADGGQSSVDPHGVSGIPKGGAGAVVAGIGALVLVLTCVGYARLVSLAEQAEAESGILGPAEGYGFMTIILIFPCLLGAGLLIGGVSSRTRRPPKM